MMEQYFEIKNQYKDYLLFYRLGDFYEMFFDDAIVASRALDLTLTGRDCGEAERAPMCGVPFHAVDTYIGRLIEQGFKIAICEQMENPAEAKGIVKRDVIRVITPGTLIESELLSDKKNNYLCSVYFGEFECGVCFCDISTADIYATCFSGDEMESKLQNELATYQPVEVVANLGAAKFKDTAQFIKGRLEAMLNDGQMNRFEYDGCLDRVRTQFAETLREEDVSEKTIVCAVGAMLDYVKDAQKKDIAYINKLNLYSNGQYLELDVNTRRNLELCEAMRSKDKKGTLLWVLDKTRSSLGARLLRKWVEHPLLSSSQIVRRQNAIEELYNNFMLREQISELLDHVLDLERLMTKIVYGSANARDLIAVANSTRILPELKSMLSECKSNEMQRICSELDTLEDICTLIDTAINIDAPLTVREGGMISDGYNSDVDELRSIVEHGDEWKEQIAQNERDATGIKNLKVGYNRVFGFYIEVTKSQLSMVPERYIRKQTLANCERYITEELKEMEAKVLGASDKLCSLEYDLFCSIRSSVADNSTRIQKAAELLAQIDSYYSLATVAAKNRYIRPTVNATDEIIIKDGRHPVVEQFVKDTYFVPNDTNLNMKTDRLLLITGPNMAGKSTYMRQVALIVLMAQMGSFVPATEAIIGITDKIFTRVGASDDLASGQSTFMLEMNEVAYILRNATKKSLIIYDEVGRGTSTFDGMSIARAIVEYTASRKIGAKTLFATHYHELTSMEDEFDGIVNYNIAAKKRGDSITFLRKIVRGSTDDSYGIEVAKLAGLPNEVIKRAKEILQSVEQSAKSIKLTDREAKTEEKDDTLISFDDCMSEQIIDEIKNTDINTLSPYECMSLVFDWKKRLG
ncbi:MAG: DNA mismatch repair protein MutS [Ruminococcaceae bacterium]|nr:DNA mismatch repair protein MutS [Oscillospiraceae bacterium]